MFNISKFFKNIKYPAHLISSNAQGIFLSPPAKIFCSLRIRFCAHNLHRKSLFIQHELSIDCLLFQAFHLLTL